MLHYYYRQKIGKIILLIELIGQKKYIILNYNTINQTFFSVNFGLSGVKILVKFSIIISIIINLISLYSSLS